MTTTRAAFGFGLLREMPAPDLLVMDEASQVSLAYALAFLPLAKAVMFAGDPEQLAPIVRVEHPSAQTWLGGSPFNLRDHLARPEGTVFLEEQSRMTPEICSVIGDVFYEGRLKVCARATADSAWRAMRKGAQADGKGFEVVQMKFGGLYSQGRGGFIRKESAEAVVNLVKLLLRRLEPDDIQVLTPFRAQRKMIRSKAKQAGISKLRVSTVHRAQGSERKVILFDPVQGSGNFFEGASGRRLINVALSRAQAQVYLFLATDDLLNPTFELIAQKLGFKQETGVPLMCELSSHPQLEQILRGKTFVYRGAVVRCESVVDYGSKAVLKHVRGKPLEGKFGIKCMQGICRDRKQCPLHKGPDAPRCAS
jgi:superfamily I DNA and/or RNA helicase